VRFAYYGEKEVGLNTLTTLNYSWDC